MAGKIPSLKVALEQSLRNLGLDRRFQAERALGLWSQIVGPVVAKVAQATEVRNGTLFVDVADSIWMQELKFQERGLLDRLNGTLGEPLVRRLFLRLARTSPPLLDRQGEVQAMARAELPRDPQREFALGHEVAEVRDPQLREALKGLRRRLLQGRSPHESGRGSEPG